MTDWNALIWLCAVLMWMYNLIVYMGNREQRLIKVHRDRMNWAWWSETLEYRQRIYKQYGVNEDEIYLANW